VNQQIKRSFRVMILQIDIDDIRNVHVVNPAQPEAAFTAEEVLTVFEALHDLAESMALCGCCLDDVRFAPRRVA